MIAVLGGLADVERDLIRTRTGEGRSRAQKRGQHMGPPPKLTAAQQAEARRRRAEGAILAELARSYGVGKARFRGSLSDWADRRQVARRRRRRRPPTPIKAKLDGSGASATGGRCRLLAPFASGYGEGDKRRIGPIRPPRRIPSCRLLPHNTPATLIRARAAPAAGRSATRCRRTSASGLSLSKPIKGAILPSKPPGIWRMSA